MNDDKKLLVLTTFFPPAPEIAAARLKPIFKHLLRLGWEIHAVAPTGKRCDFTTDEVLSKIHIYPAGSLSGGVAGGARRLKCTQNLKSLLKRAVPAWAVRHLRSAASSSKSRRWSKAAYAAAAKAIKENDIKLVLATIPGVGALAVGARLRREIPGVKLICEIRDIISGNIIYSSVKSRREYRHDCAAEKASLPLADGFIYLTGAIAEHYLRYSAINERVMTGIVLTNGFDAESQPAPVERGDRGGMLAINHLGHFYGSRNPKAFCAGMAELAHRDPKAAADITVNFIGKIDAKLKGELLKSCRDGGFGDRITFSDPVSHDDALRFMYGSDVNLIITHSAGSEYALPGKIFEYIGAGRPIFAVTSDPLLVKLINDEQIGRTCRNEPVQIADCLQAIHTEWKRGGLNANTVRNAKYETGNIVKRLDGYLSKYF